MEMETLRTRVVSTRSESGRSEIALVSLPRVTISSVLARMSRRIFPLFFDSLPSANALSFVSEFDYQLDNGTITLRNNGNSCGIVDNKFSCARTAPRYKITMVRCSSLTFQRTRLIDLWCKNRFNNLINKSTDSSRFFAPTTPSSSKSRSQISISTDEDSVALRLVLA